MEFRYDHLGRWTEERSFEVTKERIRLYAAATNDTNEGHLRGEIAPPVFAVVPGLFGVHGEARAMVIQSEAPGYDTRMLHGEHDVTLLAPILPGMHLRARAAVVGIEVKSSGTLVVVRTETRNEKGGLMNYQYATNFVRGVQAPRSAGERAPTHEPANDVDHRNPVAGVGYHVDKDQTYRYAEASGDRGPYHLDEAVAKSAGFPGLILHGLCTMALGSRAVVETVCSHDGTRVKRLAVRFTRPVLLGQDITTTIWAAGKSPRSHMYAFEIVDASGQAVIKKGLAEVATGAQ